MNQNSKMTKLYYLNQMDQNKLKEIKKKRREQTPRFIDKFECDIKESETIVLFKLANDLRHFGNELSHWLNNNYFQMKRTKKYKTAIIQYAKCKNKIKQLESKKEQKTKEYTCFINKLEDIKNELKILQENFKLTWTACRKQSEELGKNEQYAYINSIFKLSKSKDIWAGMEKVLFKKGKKLNYKQSKQLPIIQAQQLERGITYRFDENDNLILNVGFSRESKIKSLNLTLQSIKKKDIFLQEEYERLYTFLRNPKELEDNAIEEFVKNKKLIDIHRVCYFSIQCKEIRGKKRVFILFTIEGYPSVKKRIIKNANGTTTIIHRHNFYNQKKKQRIAFDEGTQSYAFVSKYKIELENIGERNEKIINQNERKEQLLSRSLGRSRMINNQQNYDNNGKIIKGKKKWYKSKNYIKKQKKHNELCRANALSRKYAINEDVNKARTYGNELVIEPSNFNALKKKSKNTKETNKTITINKKDGTIITIKKKSKRKRFGKSINRRSPGYMFNRLVSAFSMNGCNCIIVKNTVKASQYDHELNKFIKKKLSQRFHIFSDGTKIQRDIYSAFLLYCVNEDGTKVDRKKCLDFFDEFYRMFLILEDDIKRNKKQICNSGYKF